MKRKKEIKIWKINFNLKLKIIAMNLLNTNITGHVPPQIMTNGKVVNNGVSIHEIEDTSSEDEDYEEAEPVSATLVRLMLSA